MNSFTSVVKFSANLVLNRLRYTWETDGARILVRRTSIPTPLQIFIQGYGHFHYDCFILRNYSDDCDSLHNEYNY